MITKDNFLEEKKNLEEFIAKEKNTIDQITLNIFKIQSALNAVNAELDKFPEEKPTNKKFFKRK